MKDEHELPEARLRIRWDKNGRFKILTIDGTYLETVSRKIMTPLMLSEAARSDYLAKHGIASDKLPA